MTLMRMLAWFGLGAGMIVVEFLMASRVGPPADAAAKLTDQVMVMATILCVGGGLAAALIFPSTALGPAWLVIALGLLVGGAGLALRAAAMYFLGPHYTLTPGIAGDHVLVTRGPYHVIRHPGYAGNLLQLLGLGLVVGSFLSVAFVLVVVAVLPIRIRLEERILRDHFGPDYGRYIRRTRHRLIPGVM